MKITEQIFFFRIHLKIRKKHQSKHNKNKFGFIFVKSSEFLSIKTNLSKIYTVVKPIYLELVTLSDNFHYSIPCGVFPSTSRKGF